MSLSRVSAVAWYSRERAARRIGHVIGRVAAEQIGAAAAVGGPGEPVAKRLAGGAGAGLHAPAEQARGA